MFLRVGFPLSVALVAALAVAPAAPAQDGLRLDLNIPANRLVLFDGDREVRSYPVSVGVTGHNTPTGEFTISRAEWNPWWRPPAREWAKNDKITPPGPNNPMGRVKLYFAPYYFIHGTPDKDNIGSPASHGCVRMLNSDVIALGKLLHAQAAPQVNSKAIDSILSRSGTTRVVPFRDSIPLTIRYDPIVVRDGKVHVYPDFYGYKAIHAEGVYQALLSAGYDVNRVESAAVQRLVKRARSAKSAFAVPLDEAFGPELAAASR